MLPVFTELQIDKIPKTVDKFLEQNLNKINQLALNPTPSWNNLFEPLQLVDNEFNNYWAIVSHLNSVKNNPKLRKVYNQCLPKISKYSTTVSQHLDLYNACQRVFLRDDFNQLNSAQQQTVKNTLRDFKLSGVDLPKDQKLFFQNINLKLSELTSKFSENVLDCTNSWQKNITDKNLLTGIPKDTLKLAQQKARQNQQQGYTLSLDFPCYQAVMSYAENRQLRFEFYQAHITRASKEGVHDHQFDNSEIMFEILKLKAQKATLLGFDSYAHYSIATKMADSTDEVFNFLSDLLDRSFERAQDEIKQLKQFADELGLDDLQAWDLSFYAEKLKQRMFNFNSFELKPWLPIDKALSGLFTICKKLFGIDIEEVFGANVWHDDVRVFAIKNTDIKAYFYFDLYARENKQGGAWMDVCREQVRLADGSTQVPIAYLTCNFTPAVETQPALITHEELTTLFHEFGHGLHHMLSEVDIPSVGGINGVPWDAVELPSQFLENFCWQKEVLPLISGHFETEKPLPADKLNSLIQAKNFNSALAMIRQLEFALFDFHLHHDFIEDDNIVEASLARVKKKTAILNTPTWARFANSFSHIFAGGYAAGYYSYKWAEVLSADTFSLFEQNGILCEDTGNSFLSHILQKGGSEEIMDLFIKFRGRKPDIQALLRHSGISQ